MALGFGVWRFRAGVPGDLGEGRLVALVILLAGPVLGVFEGLARGRGLRIAAAAADRVYHLKDRTITAVEFAASGCPTPIHALQVADARSHLSRVDPRRVAPHRMPRLAPYAALSVILALGLLLWSRPTPVQAMPAQPLETIVAAADEASEDLAQLEQAAVREQSPELKKLLQKLNESVQQLKLPGVDVKEALAKLSEMQATVAAEQAQFNIGLVDAVMQKLGEVMASTRAYNGAGQALQNGKYDQAAEQLDKVQPTFDPTEAKALKEKLAQAARDMQDAGLTDLSTATTELAHALDDEGAVASTCKKLGNIARSHGRRSRLKNLLSMTSRSLSQCKSNCQKNSTNCTRLRKKSDKPSSNWGMGISGNTDGDRTKLDSARKREQVTGEMGEGASESETTHLPEGRQLAARNYREHYQKYRRQSESALDSEPLPLGQRETIKRYFELIRPQD